MFIYMNIHTFTYIYKSIYRYTYTCTHIYTIVLLFCDTGLHVQKKNTEFRFLLFCFSIQASMSTRDWCGGTTVRYL